MSGKKNLKMFFFFHFSARIRRESLSLARLRSAEERASKTETGKTVPPPVSSPSLHVTRSWPGSRRVDGLSLESVGGFLGGGQLIASLVDNVGDLSLLSLQLGNESLLLLELGLVGLDSLVQGDLLLLGGGDAELQEAEIHDGLVDLLRLLVELLLETGDLLLESLAGDFEVVLQRLLLDVELLLETGDLSLQIRLLLGQSGFGAVGVGGSRLQNGEVGFESGDLFAKGDILLLELRLQGGLGISLIVQGLELLLGDFGHFSGLSFVCS